MCGIFAYFSSNPISEEKKNLLWIVANKSKHRGPDMTRAQLINNNNTHGYLVFHRLCIVDVSERGMQPFSYQGYYSICNGEIYNHQELRKRYNFSLISNSDCEVIIPLIRELGISHACPWFDGVFAFTVVTPNGEILVGRDPFGVRSLYVGTNQDGDLCISSEMKSIPDNFQVKPFPPGTYSQYQLVDQSYTEITNNRYYLYDYPIQKSLNEKNIVTTIRKLLEDAVQKRLMSDRPIGCLLSGGLDSSIIAALLANQYQTSERKLKTFSVGLAESIDLKYARIMANHLGTDHTELILTEDEMFDLIKDDIYHIESYDTTTVRASTPMYALCKYIKNTTDITVVFSGEGSDEASGSYMYFHNAPDSENFYHETIRLLTELHRFDVLRCDKSSAAAGLEIRVPFLDKAFINYYMTLNPAQKIPNGQIEKRLLRQAFSDLLPDSITWRVKEGMSDGVSSMKRPWFKIIQDRVADQYAEKDYLSYSDDPNPPKFNEALYFREIFESYYGGRATVIPHYWLPKWSGNLVEPSARVLSVYDLNLENSKADILSTSSTSIFQK